MNFSGYQIVKEILKEDYLNIRSMKKDEFLEQVD